MTCRAGVSPVSSVVCSVTNDALSLLVTDEAGTPWLCHPGAVSSYGETRDTKHHNVLPNLGHLLVWQYDDSSLVVSSLIYAALYM